MRKMLIFPNLQRETFETTQSSIRSHDLNNPRIQEIGMECSFQKDKR